MLIHITPKIYVPNFDDISSCELINFSIDELGFVLIGNKDIATRRPYPNKRYFVGCRKENRKAASGILVEAKELSMDSFTSVAHWKVYPDEYRSGDIVVTHKVKYVIIDNDFDMVSDDMTLWYATRADSSGRPSRWPEFYKKPPNEVQPTMDVFSSRSGGLARDGQDKKDTVKNFLNKDLIVNRSEVFKIPTIERARLFDKQFHLHEMPELKDAWLV
jgi:hypothetical protein